MKILVVCQYYYPEPFRVTDICESLVERGHNVTVLTGLPNYPEGRVLDEYRYGKKKKETINGVNIIRCFVIGRGNNNLTLFLNYLSYAVSATLKVLFINEKFDVVLVNQLSPIMMGIPAMVYKNKHHKKVLFYCLDLWPDSLTAGGIKEGSTVYRLFFKISKWIYKSADAILVTSSMFKDYFENILMINNIRIEHLPQYAEDLFIENDNKAVTEAVVSTDSKGLNFVFAGNIGELQSVETIIRAANELYKRHINISFHIVGDGSNYNYCKQLTNDFGITNVKFYGRRPLNEMPKFYKMADAMLITLKDNITLSYTLPGKVQTYMASGKPIIGSINGETRRVIEKSGCGLCCKAEDYVGLAHLILEFCSSNKKEQMAINARNFYFENYNKEKFLATLEEELIKLEVQNVYR